MSRAENGGEGGVSFDPAAIRRRLPSTLSDRQERALIAAIRNPDAPVKEVAQATAVEPRHVRHALDSLACGVLGADSHGGEWIRERGDTRQAETFAELTEKQAAVVDTLARNPAVEDALDDMTNREALAAVESAADDLPDIHYTYPSKVAEQYDDLIQSRRRYLADRGEIDLGGEDDIVATTLDSSVPGHAEPTRKLLDAHGYDLPESNLDSLAEVGEALSDDERLDLAFERASDLDDAPRSTAQGDDGDESEADIRDYRDDPLFEDEDVETGVPYRAVVNGVVEWGVWFTLAGDPTRPDDVSGVVPVERLAEHGTRPDEFEVGDVAVVVPTGRSTTNDGKVRHRLDLYGGDEQAESGDVSESSTETPETTDDGGESDGDHTQATLGDVSGEGVPAERVAELERRLDEQAERMDTLERENERLREQVETNAEAVPDGETAQELNAAAEAILDADLDDLRESVESVERRVEDTYHYTNDRIDELEGRVELSGVGDALDALAESGYDVELSTDGSAE